MFCTVYFTEDEGQRHVIAATDGLSSNVIGQVHAGFGEGVAGRIAESHRPLNLEALPPEWDHDFLSQTESHSTGRSCAGGAQAKVLRRACWIRQRKARRLTMPMKLC